MRQARAVVRAECVLDALLVMPHGVRHEPNDLVGNRACALEILGALEAHHRPLENVKAIFAITRFEQGLRQLLPQGPVHGLVVDAPAKGVDRPGERRVGVSRV